MSRPPSFTWTVGRNLSEQRRFRGVSQVVIGRLSQIPVISLALSEPARATATPAARVSAIMPVELNWSRYSGGTRHGRVGGPLKHPLQVIDLRDETAPNRRSRPPGTGCGHRSGRRGHPARGRSTPGPGLTLDERDRLVEWRPARTGVTHRDVLVPDRHATEEDEAVRG
jgi:hypothetical protein